MAGTIHPNAELLRRAYGLRDEAQLEPVRDWLHPEITWHIPSGDLKGPDEVLAMLAQSDEIAQGTISREIHALFADDEYGMVLTTLRAHADDRSLKDRQVHVYRFEDGKVIEFWQFLSGSQADDDFLRS